MDELIRIDSTQGRVELTSAIELPRASTFLWNRGMLLQLNCRGYAVAQHTQPEPGKYSHAPVLERTTFMQPELPFYAHHPGRFVYVKDEDDGTVYSVPHEPVRRPPEEFRFIVEPNLVSWQHLNCGIETELSVSIPADDVVELWSLVVRNRSDKARRLSIYPSFTVGYMSWMNQSAAYDRDLGGIVASSITPYQKLEDYERVRNFKDSTYLLHDTKPDAWEACREAFEGEGGIASPDGIAAPELAKGDALYETPIATLQYRRELAAGESIELRFLFGPANNVGDIRRLRDRYLAPGGFEEARANRSNGKGDIPGAVTVSSPNEPLDAFVNTWLSRQVYYHGDVNRMTTDPQTRNYLQDAMGMAFLEPLVARNAITEALSQQDPDGGMPDGIVLHNGATLKYINEIPHTDHCVWLPIAIQAYLDETGDLGLLERPVTDQAGDSAPVLERVTRAMRWLVENCDQRGLSLIAQGDWCDPMNMVGHRGSGVSGWLSMASVYALRLWADIAERVADARTAADCRQDADRIADAVQAHLWDGDWFARGINDDGQRFGVADDDQGRIYINAQSWAMLAGIATSEQTERMLAAIDAQLESPYGVMMLAPAYTKMHEGIGRITQKHPGYAENGGIYNHAAAFYIRALFEIGEPERAYEAILKMLPLSTDDCLRRGQLPVFVPNYYRGAIHEYPRTAGRSSQLFNTGAASWLYRIIVENLYGLRGDDRGLRIDPAFPRDWTHAEIQRQFRGAWLSVRYERESPGNPAGIRVDGEVLEGEPVIEVVAGRHYEVDVVMAGDQHG